MKKIHVILIAVLLPVVFTSCQKISGKGDVVTESRSATGFSAVSLAMDATVQITNGTETTVEVIAQENLLPYIQTNPENGRLVIKVKNNVVLGNHEPILIRISSPDVRQLDVSGSGEIEVLNEWTGTTLEADISGSGSIFLQHVLCETLKAHISGSGSIEASGGQAGSEDLDISGSGDIELRYVVAANVDAHISGSGNIYTQATNLLDATISGSGSIYYLGTPQINAHVSGSGSILKIL